MKDEEIKRKLFARLYNSVPRAIWSLSASFSIIILSLSISLNFAHIRAGDALNDYMQILLKREVNSKNLSSNNIEQQLIELKQEVEQLKLLSHEASK